MELRLDQIAYMIIAAHLIHSKVTYAQIHTHEHELKADNNDLGTANKTNNPGNWPTVCHTYTGKFL